MYDVSGRDNGDILSIADTLAPSRNQTFSYDSLNRIVTGAQADNSFNLTFSYDAWGNMKESGTSNLGSISFDVTNRITSPATCATSLAPFCYDAAGDLLVDNHSHAFTYDAEARIKTVDGTAATYTYNPLGNRVRKEAGATSTEYFFFGGNVIAELNPSTGAYTDYIFGYGKRIAKDTSSNGSGAQYYHDDQIGSARVMTDPAGTKIMDCTFNPFGEQVSCSLDNASNHYRFSGKEYDSESQLDDFGSRYYSSSIGRWATPDWSERPTAVPYAVFGDPQSLNLYLYVRNDPVSRADADGHADDNADPDHPVPAYKKFEAALKNILSVKTEVGAGYKLSASIGGLKVSAGSGVSTETKSYPLGNHPTEVTSKAETKLEVKVGPVAGELKNKVPTIDPKTGTIDKGGPDVKVGASGEHVSGIGISSDHEISVIGATVRVGPAGGGVEIVLNTQEISEAAKSFVPAVLDGISVLTGIGAQSNPLPNNPFPGLQNPIPQ